jgi:O-antigen/teichoic acid export membrane protein
MVGIWAFIDFIKYFLASDYWVGLNVLPILLLASVFLGIYMNLSIWYKLTNRTIYALWITLLGVVITVIINWVGIPLFGYWASAWATLAAYFSMVLVSYGLGQKYYKVPYRVYDILYSILWAVFVTYLMNYMPKILVIKILVWVIFVVGLLYLNRYYIKKHMNHES